MRRNEQDLGITRRTKCLTFGILFLFILISAPSDAQLPGNGRSVSIFFSLQSAKEADENFVCKNNTCN